MKGFKISAALAVLLAAAVLTAQESGESDTAEHMHEHLVRLTDIKAEIVAGNLEGTREPARWLAGHDPIDNLSLQFEPFVLSMRENARSIVDAGDIETAAAAVSAIAQDCAACHTAYGINLKFGFDQEPPQWSDLESHMQRHQWAVDRLWEGLIGPSDGSWSRGIKMLAEAPLNGTQATWDDDVHDDEAGDELARQVHTLGRQAAAALTPEARSAVYGKIVGTCADCHTQTGGGPGS